MGLEGAHEGDVCLLEERFHFVEDLLFGILC